MTTVPSAVPSEATQPALSEPARLVNVFFAPSRTFQNLKRRSSWWVPWLILSVFSLLATIAVSQKIGFERITRQQIEHSGRAQQFETIKTTLKMRRRSLEQ